MKKLFKIKYLQFLFVALTPLAAIAAEGVAENKRLGSEERKARVEQRIAECKADPEKCRAQFQARREQWCKDNAERCQEIQARIEKRIAECQADPEKCRAQRQARYAQWCNAHPERCKEMQARLEKRLAECKANPASCRAEIQARFEQRFKHADADGNGLISREEAEKVMPGFARRFDVIDVNRDGQVSIEEIATARKIRHGERGRRGFERKAPNSI